jgi:asparagine synthase (glutamine-hydrolysing)
MCGICGVISADPRPVEPAVRGMMRAMVHRGPDDEGFEILPLGGSETSGPVAGFGFRRLAILDLSAAGHQPMFNQRTGDCLIFNGEIYNFRQLRTELQMAGVVFRSTSDTEVLLQALCTWGEAAVEKLQGMFAFAFYHASSQRILLARDPLGIKPLYVAALPDRFLFASEVRAILASGLVPDDLDPAGIAAFLAYGSPQDPLTVHKHIRSMPPGTLCWVDGADVSAGKVPSERLFWRLPPAEPDGVSPEEAAARVRAVLEAVLAEHLVADVPVGIFLSAGIDSTSIAALARRLRAQVRTFTVGFESQLGSDEVAAAEALAKEAGTEHTSIVMESQTVLDLWERWLASADRPSVDGFNTFVVSACVRGQGKIVALSGLGADEIFGGYPHFNTIVSYQRYVRLSKMVPAGLARWGLNLAMRNRTPHFRQRAWELFAGSSDASRVALQVRRILGDAQLESLGLPANLPGLAAEYLPEGAVQAGMPLGSQRSSRHADPRSFNVISRQEVALYMNNTLRDTDVTSMANSQEVRVPMLDRRLVELVASLPASVKQPRKGQLKPLLRDACRDVLPEWLMQRPKSGFSLPIDRWMHVELRDSCEAALDQLQRCTCINTAAARDMWQEFVSAPNNVHWIRPMTLIALGNYLGRAAAASQPSR